MKKRPQSSRDSPPTPRRAAPDRPPRKSGKARKDAASRQSRATAAQHLADTQADILNALPAHIALLDRTGVILSVNESWRRFAAANAARSTEFYVGQNYLAVCDAATGECAEEARATAAGIRAVLAGRLPEFSLEYPCHSPTERRWFRVMVTPRSSAALDGVVVMHINVTPRRLAEEAVRESKDRLDFALEVNAIGTWDLDLATHTAHRSLIHDRIFGYESLLPSWTYEDFLGHVLPEDRAEVDRKFKEALAARARWDFECRIRRRDGKVRWIWATGTHYTSPEGGLKISGLVQDITARQRATEVLAESQRKYRDLVETSHDLIWSFDAEGVIRYMNRACRAIFGREPEEMVGHNFREFLPPEELAAAESAFRAALEEGREESGYLIRVLRSDGGKVTLSVNSRIIRDADGHIVGGTCNARDVTASQEAQAALALSEERFRLMVEGSDQVLYYTHDREHRFEYLSPSTFAVIGYRPEELVGQPCDILVIPDDPINATVHDETERALRDGVPCDPYLAVVRHKDGRRIVFEIMESPILRDGQVVGIQGFARDITARETARAQVAESEVRFRTLFDQAAVGMCLVDLDGRFRRVNRRLCEILGYPEETLLTRGCVETTHPDDRAREAVTVERMIAGDFPSASWEKRYLHRQGHAVWCNLTLSLLPTAGDQPRQFVGVIEDITERQRSRDALAAREREFRTLAEAMPQIVWITDPEGRNLYFNQHWMDYTGLTAEESHGYGWSKPFHPEDRAQAEAAWQRATSTLAEYSLESRLRRADGAYRWWLIRGEPHKDAEGRVLKWFGTCTDIHDLKQAQLEISRANRALRMLSSCNEALIHATAEDELLQKICDLSVAVGGYRMAWVGYAEDDAARTVRPYAHAGADDGYLATISITWREDDPRSNGPAGRTIRSGQLVVCPNLQEDPQFAVWRDVAVRHGFGGAVCLPLKDRRRTFGVLTLYSAGPAETNAQEMALLQELADDLSFGIQTLRAAEQRRLADAKVREQAALLDNSHEAIIVKDRDGRIIYWNKGSERVYGWTAAEALGQAADDLLAVDPAPVREAEAILHAADQWEGELSQRHKSGTLLTVRARWTLVRDEAGEPKSVLSICSDITETKKLEQQFLRAQRLESIGTLAGGIAHDLNNLLSPIMMGVSLLRRQETHPASQAVIAAIEQSAERGAKLVKQVLSFARGVEGLRISLRLAHIVREIESIIANTFPKNIQLRTSIPADLPPVLGDPTHLHQVLLNLCVNARDAMPRGGTLTIAASETMVDAQYAAMNRELRPGSYVVLEVTDTGTGIPPEIIDRIFEPFFTTKEQGHGTGLGLSTVLGIVRSHGGFVHVTSDPGRQTTFKVYLRAQVESAAEPSPLAATAPAALPRGRGETILVVDDETTILGITRQTLESSGYRVLTAEDGAQAIATYAQRKGDIALVITDMMMPVMDGPTLVHALRTINPRCKVIGASGLGSNFTGSRMAQQGIEHFLEKPFSAPVLLELVRQVLDRP